MGSVPLDILIDGRRIGCAYFGNDGHLISETVTRASTSTVPLIPRRECKHVSTADRFAYNEWYNEHWPVRVCLDCRSILEGRNPHPTRRGRRAWEIEVEDVIAAHWSKQWPKRGRPRRKKPPASTEWPKAA